MLYVRVFKKEIRYEIKTSKKNNEEHPFKSSYGIIIWNHYMELDVQ